jgi:hypothetical protein
MLLPLVFSVWWGGMHAVDPTPPDNPLLPACQMSESRLLAMVPCCLPNERQLPAVRMVFWLFSLLSYLPSQEEVLRYQRGGSHGRQGAGPKLCEGS